MIFLLAMVAAVIALLSSGLQLWRWAGGRSVAYRVAAGVLVAAGLYVLLLAVGLFLNPI